ncbi:putative uncharacterized protein DDB_G0294196 [Gigantopelta aegis]|uniref:putative uncharacterized protein DDB_G0294196 n=1 Tax=Gigantopelta aegis TaxID=1735272 RepID=UPI001B88D909|nr:putative uncharacterized protein DDB_G0294196 [Gigantopelta aegis]
MNQTHKIVFFYQDHVSVKLWEKNSKVYVHLNKVTKKGTKTVSFQAEAYRALMERGNDVLKAIDEIEAELQEESEMVSLTDETKFHLQQQQDQAQEFQPLQPVQPQQQQPEQQQPQRERHSLSTNSRFQPYTGTGTSIQFGLGRGALITRPTLGHGQEVPNSATRSPSVMGRGRGLLAALQQQQQQTASTRYTTISPTLIE